MGRTLEDKKQIVSELKLALSSAQLAMVIDYQGLTVAEITDLRNRLREANATCKVTKNTLMRIAVEGNATWQPMTELLKESSAFLLVNDDLGGAIKAYQAFQKASKKTILRGGIMDGRVLSEADVTAIGDLPSYPELMAQVAGALNAVTAKIAVGINEVPSSLARCLQAIAEPEQQDAA